MTVQSYSTTPPERSAIDAGRGLMVLEFGTGWCGWCRAAQPILSAAFDKHPDVPRLRVEDGPGRPLGRSFKVKLWPTLIFLQDGVEITRVVRPPDAATVEGAFDRLLAAGDGEPAHS